MRTKLWIGVGAFVIAKSGQAVIGDAAAKPLSPPAQQVGEGEGEGEGEGRRVVRSGKARHAVTSPRRARAVQQQRGQRGEGEYEGGENERGEGGENEGGEGER